MRRAALLSALALAAAGFTHGPLIPGPGSGIRTATPAMVRPLREDVSFVPILTVGDTLAVSDTATVPYVFPPMPSGLGILPTNSGLAEIYVAHDLSYDRRVGGARVSRIAIDIRNMGALAGDFLIEGEDGYSRFASGTVGAAREGFLIPKFLVGEDRIDGPGRGLFTAVDTRDGTVTNLPWLGRFAHGGSAIVPTSTGKMALILPEDDIPGESQLYMYLADNDDALLHGRGQLFVFRADPGQDRTRLSSRAARNAPLTGHFVPIDVTFGNDYAPPDRIEARAQSVGCTNFVRLRDATPDRSRANIFYFADAGANNFYDPRTGRLVTGAGRIYRMELDPFDPTHVVDLRVILDGDDGDDIYGPDALASDSRYLWIQEDPGGVRGLHPSRILRYDLDASRLEILAECAERDAKGAMLSQGVGGVWKTTGIVDASEIFGADTWLISVQAPNQKQARPWDELGSGQILLLRGPGWTPPKEKKPKRS
jgi:hypothetical protein